MAEDGGDDEYERCREDLKKLPAVEELLEKQRQLLATLTHTLTTATKATQQQQQQQQQQRQQQQQQPAPAPTAKHLAECARATVETLLSERVCGVSIRAQRLVELQ